MSTAIIKPEWSFITIVIMVIGFIVWWPLGLAMIAYIIWGERFGGSAEKAEAWIKEKKGWAKKQKCRSRRHRGGRNSSGNEAFDDYRDEQLRRLDEERRRLDAEVRDFSDYMHNLHKARDRDEFDRYMNSRDQERRNGDDYSEDLGAEGDSKADKTKDKKSN